jgi:hypothetical protein
LVLLWRDSGAPILRSEKNSVGYSTETKGGQRSQIIKGSGGSSSTTEKRW